MKMLCNDNDNDNDEREVFLEGVASVRLVFRRCYIKLLK